MTRTVAVDSVTALVHTTGGIAVEQVDDDRRPRNRRRAEDVYATEADALRAVVTGAVRFGQWREAR